jgi:divalent metal cation (Fe/Co/Zn/Cd) transporter
LGIYMNLLLFALKAAGGILGQSAAMIADAGHTLSDLVSDAGACHVMCRGCVCVLRGVSKPLLACSAHPRVSKSYAYPPPFSPVTLWAVRMSALPPDADHPYGHGRFEAVGSLGVSVLLLGTAWHIAAHAYDKLQHCMDLASFALPFGPWLGE